MTSAEAPRAAPPVGTSPRRRVPLFGKIIVGLVGLVLAWSVLVPNTVTEEVRVEQCSSCFAVRRTSESGIRFYGKRLVDGGIVVEEDRSGATDLGPLLGDGHRHQWAFSAHHSYFVGLHTGVACGFSPFNPVGRAIRDVAEVRTRIEERIASGEFTLEEVAAILALPGAPSGAETESPARGHLYRRGQDLLRAVGCEEARRWPGAGLATHPSVCPCQKER